MSANMNASRFRVSMPFGSIPTDKAAEVVTAALRILRGAKQLHRRPQKVARILDAQHTPDYVTDMLAERRSLPFSGWVRLLFALDTETVRRVLQVVASPFGLNVVPVADATVKDLRSEVMEAAAACGFAHHRVH